MRKGKTATTENAAPVFTSGKVGPYVRVKLTSGRTFWAEVVKRAAPAWAPDTPATVYTVRTKTGAEPDKAIELVIAGEADVESERPAKLDTKYGWLEVVR